VPPEKHGIAKIVEIGGVSRCCGTSKTPPDSPTEGGVILLQPAYHPFGWYAPEKHFS